MEEGLLSLKWNNHKSTFFHVLSILREKHTYTDVTLACDGRLYPAHKFVLSTCSEYFSDIFTSTSGNNIVIVLKDVRRQDLEYLLDYMYLGQVDVAQSELSSLIKTAECLRIKGLAIPDDEPQKTPRRLAEEREREGSPPTKKKRHLVEEDRGNSLSSSSSASRISHLTLPPPSLPPPSQPQPGLLQRLQQQPTLTQPPQPQATSQSSSSKSHAPSLSQPVVTPPHTPRTPQVPTSPITPTSAHTHTSLASPTQATTIPVIKQEVTDPPEAPEVYMNESYEEQETKPDVSETGHLEQDMAVAGPSGLQGHADNWEGDNDLGGFTGGDSYPEGAMEEPGDSEVQGGPSSRDCPLGDAEDFLRRLEDKTHHQSQQQPSTSAATSAEGIGRVFATTTAPPLPQQARPYLTPHVYANASTVTATAGTANQVVAPTTLRPTDSPSSSAASFLCRMCSYVAKDVRDLITHNQQHKWDEEQQQPQLRQSSDVRSQRIFKCPYCDVQVKGRAAIENHVVNHSAGDDGPERLYWCSFCTLKCRSAPGLSSHLKRHAYQGDF